jgi:hypothetical protein
MPVNNSLIGIMKRAGYHTAFYYGGDSKFDNMKLFLQKKVSIKSMMSQLLQAQDISNLPKMVHLLGVMTTKVYLNDTLM